jgi:hypothetical protein
MDGSTLREKSQSIPGTSSLSRGIVSYFELGRWLASATGFDGLLDELLKIGKKIFLGAKMFDIDEAVKRGRQEQQSAAVSLLAVHGDDYRPRAAVTGPSRGADRRGGGLHRRRPPDRQKRRTRARGRAKHLGYAPRHSRPGFAPLLGLAPL